MNRFKLHTAGINISEGMERLGLDKAIFEGILFTFVKDDSFNKMCTAIEERDCSSAFLHAHSLKGISANLSISTLNLLISPIVEILRNGSFEGVDELLPPAKESYNIVVDTLIQEHEKDNS